MNLDGNTLFNHFFTFKNVFYHWNIDFKMGSFFPLFDAYLMPISAHSMPISSKILLPEYNNYVVCIKNRSIHRWKKLLIIHLLNKSLVNFFGGFYLYKNIHFAILVAK